ncbi:MAG: alpha/beta fold hydrolase, partial [Myxococcales bacterium]|nr:alpha/beta fold hydrolase [Myxococcales bacterium]
RGSGKHGVVLVHPYHGSRAEWGDLPEVLDGQGANVVSIDLRGHGDSKGEIDGPKMVEDVKAAVGYLRKKGVEKVTIIGAGLGANVALAAAAADAEVTDVVMITPRLDANGVKVSTSLKGFGRRPLLLISGSDDSLSIKASEMIADRVDTARVEVLSAEGTGLKLINRDSNIQGILVSWFNGAYAVASGDSSLDLNTEGGQQLETTGVKLGEKKK